MVRRELGIPTVKWNYDQSAVVAVLHLSEVSFPHILLWRLHLYIYNSQTWLFNLALLSLLLCEFTVFFLQ